MTQTPITSALAYVMKNAIATGLFVSSISIQQPSGTFGASGAPDGTYTAVSGLQNLACMDAPEAVDRYNIVSTEIRMPQQIESKEMRHVLIQGYYSQLSPSTNWGDVGWRAVMDGVTYDINAAEQDSQKQMTRLSLHRITV
jgi:hypothetical protein